MFEAYINGLRLQRRKMRDLNPSTFRHRRTVVDRPSPTGASSSGWSSWIAGVRSEVIAIAWPWAIIQHGVPALDPMRIQSNLLLLGRDDRMLNEQQTLGALLVLVTQLDWHPHALKACSVASP
jgi:hypothetical protein